MPPLFAGYVPKDQIREQPKLICPPNTGSPVLGGHISVVYLVLVLFCVVCDSGVDILLHLCHALLAGDAAEHRLADDLAVSVDNIGGRE